jgi:hypothetical protein
MADSAVDFASLEATDATQDTGLDSGVDAGQNIEISPENQESQQQQTGVEGQQQTPEALTGKAIRDAVRRLSATSPEDAKLLKQLADTHFRVATGYQSSFKTPQEATTAKQLIEAAGGVEGITQATQRLQTYDQQDAALKEGNPEVLDAMFKDFPEGAAALAPHYLDKLSQTNQTAYNEAVGPHAVAMLENAGLGRFLDAALAEPDEARSKALVKEIADWFKGQATNAKQVQQARTTQNPGADKIKQRETELNTREEKIFRDAVAAKTNAAITQPVAQVVDQYAKQYKLNDVQKAHYKTTLENAVIEEMNADHTYRQQIDLRYSNKSRTHDTVSSYAAAEFNRRAKDKAFEVAKSIYGAPKGGAAQNGTGIVKPGEAKTAPGGGPLKITAQPPDAQIDWNKPDADTAQLNFIKGRGWTKSGHFVNWR